MNPKYKVIATWGAQGYTTELGEFATLEEAMDRVNAWHEAPEVKGMRIDLLEVVKHTQSTVWSEQPATNTASAVDYERVGVNTASAVDEQVRDTFQPFDDLQETVWNLEDRHVGLRQELGADIDHVYEHIDELREQVSSATADIDHLDNLDQEMRHEVAGLRREMEALRSELQREPAIRRHAEWERQQQKNKEVSER
jgi:predicted RNase H-like nuclease (RuvC/YqgF family)